MSTIASAANMVDWLSGAWSSIQGSSGSGNAIVDAANSSSASGLTGGFTNSDFNALSNTLTAVSQNFIQEENILVAQKAVARVQNEVAAKLKAVSKQAPSTSSTTGNVLNITA
jgi:hypothetical protein